ncbi:hypothetical protein HMPREF9554_00227 [Treponema phagedenis F0421]|nr:hypothetical protein HMPREF9554_00227 [Treponema phagedenis F0421]
MPSLNPRIRRRKNSTDVLPTLYCKQAKLVGAVFLPRTAKSERAQAAGGSKQQRCFKAKLLAKL